MTQSAISDLVSPFIKNLSCAEGANLLRGEQSLNDKIIGIYYFEFSDDNGEVDLEKFLEDYISADYYNNPGYLQWNYYLIFVREPNIVNPSWKNAIEKNDIYARKFVFSPAEVLQYFSYRPSNQSIDIDIVSTWKEKLRSVDLDEVYTENYYTEAIPRFINNDVEKENVSEQRIAAPSEQTMKIDRISNLELHDTYRPYPKPQRKFAFRKVNLLQGVNGSGKTSLLTAIELIIAGKTINDPTNAEAGNCISAVYNNDSELTDIYTPNDNVKYRKRDADWFSSSYQTGNELYRAFNRYNYFDSDAAYKLAFDEDSRHITKYLSAIALGPEFGRIQNRMSGFEERLVRELKIREKTIEAQQLRIDDANKILKAVTAAGDPQKLFDLFLRDINGLGWKGTVPKTISQPADLFDADYEKVNGIVQTLLQLMEKVQLKKIDEVQVEHRKVLASISSLTSAQKDYSDMSNAVSTAKQKVDMLQKRQDILNDARKLFDYPDAFSLASIEESLTSSKIRIERNKKTIEAFDVISNSAFFKAKETLPESKKRIQVLIDNQLQIKKQIVSQRKQLAENLDQIHLVIADIKALASKYLSLESDPMACPLCSATYAPGELEERVKQLNLQNTKDNVLTVFDEQILKADEFLADQNKLLNEASEIEKVVRLVWREDVYNSFQLDKIHLELLSIKADMTDDLKVYNDLEARKNFLTSVGISKSSLTHVKLQVEQFIPEMKFELTSKEVYLSLVASNEVELTEAERGYIQATENLSEQKAVFDKVVAAIRKPESDVEIEKYLEFQKNGYSRIIVEFEKLKEFITCSDQDDVFEISILLQKIGVSNHNYRKVISEQTQINSSNEIIRVAKAEIANILPIVEKIQKALTVIREILSTDKQELILGEFLKANEKEIQDIFLALHKPKEFSSIVFDHDTATFFLRKSSSEEMVSINKISTGQRSALALSIFLALSRKNKRGPQILLFDDPITYTDDLNILSFLDYLRSIVLNENRQVFFATANKKLAGLFEKKFMFLDDDFSSVSLLRDN